MRRLIVGLLSTAVLLFANWNDTSTGINLARLNRFPLTKIRSGWLHEGRRCSFDGLVASARDRCVTLRGKGTEKPWVVYIGDAAFEQVYRGDLDGNGVQDYIFYGVDPFANGRTAPSGRITILLMDHLGLPTPFETHVYDLYLERGPRILLDLHHDGRAQLLLSSYDERHWDGRVGPFACGHWINQLLEIQDMNWVEFRGEVAGLTFPFVHRWTYWPKEALEKPWPPDKRLTVPEHSSAPSDINDSRIKLLKDSGALTLAPSPGCKDFDVGTVVYDQPTRRDIALYRANPVTDPTDELLRRMKTSGAHIRLYGLARGEGGHCSTNLLWGSN